MKLALVFLCAFVVFSHQQIQQRPRGVIWVSPYYSPQRLINGYQPQYYNNAPYVVSRKMQRLGKIALSPLILFWLYRNVRFTSEVNRMCWKYEHL
jgi:hypothetical protein